MLVQLLRIIVHYLRTSVCAKVYEGHEYWGVGDRAQKKLEGGEESLQLITGEPGIIKT